MKPVDLPIIIMFILITFFTLFFTVCYNGMLTKQSVIIQGTNTEILLNITEQNKLIIKSLTGKGAK